METILPKPSPWGRGTAAAVDEVIQTQRTYQKQTIKQNSTDNDRTYPKNRRGDSRIARQTNDLTKTNIGRQTTVLRCNQYRISWRD